MRKNPDFTETHEERMVKKFGSKEAFQRVKDSHGLIPRGNEVGLDATVGWTQEQLDKRVQSSTLDSHRLVLHVQQTLGTVISEQLYSILNRKHFLEAGVLNSPALLTSAVHELNLSSEENLRLETFLNDPNRRGTEQVLWAYAKVTGDLGISSIPTLIIDGSVMLSGSSQSDEVLLALNGVMARGGPTGHRLFE